MSGQEVISDSEPSVASEHVIYKPRHTKSKQLQPNSAKSLFSPTSSNLNKAATLDRALTHSVSFIQASHKVFKLPSSKSNSPVSKCECCMFPISGEPFKFFESIDLLYELGSSFPLYFILVKSLTVCLLIVFLQACLPCLISNAIQNDSDEWSSTSGITASTFGSYGDPWSAHGDFNVPFWQPVLHMIACLLLVLISPVISSKLRNKALEFDLLITTPSDFTVWVKGLPKDYTSEELEEFFITKSPHPVTVVNVIKAYDIKKFMQVSKRLFRWRTRLELIRSKEDNKNCCLQKKAATAEQCKAKINELCRLQEEFTKKLEEKLTSVAFVTFQTQLETRMIAKQWTMSSLQKLFTNIKLKVWKNNSILFRDSLISAELAPEPSDVYWENLSADFKSKLIRRLATYVIVLLTIGVTFISLYFIKTTQSKNSKPTTSTRISSALISLLVIFINTILTIAIRLYSKQEMHHTWSTYNLSVANKLVIAMSLNTGLIPLIVNYDYKSDWFSADGLANSILWILVANAVVSPIIYLVSPAYQLKRIRQFVAIRGNIANLSQFEANLLFEGPEVDLADRFAGVLKSCIVSLFYAPLLPIGVLISCIGVVFEALVFKYMLIRVHSRPREEGETLALQISKWIRYFPVIYSAGILVFYYPFIEEIRIPLIAGISFFSFYAISHFESFIDSRSEDKSLVLLKEMNKHDNHDNYDLNYANFLTVIEIKDYERENPVTRAEGWEKWFKFVDEHDGNENGDYSVLKRGNFKLDALNQYAERVADEENNVRRGSRKKSTVINSTPSKFNKLSKRQRETIKEMVIGDIANTENLKITATPTGREKLENTAPILGFQKYERKRKD